MAARQPTKPTWNAELRELRWGKQLVKKFKGPAANQELICAVFEEDKWAPRIDDPLPGGLTRQKRQARLHDVVARLNKSQRRLKFTLVVTAKGTACAGRRFDRPRSDPGAAIAIPKMRVNLGS